MPFLISFSLVPLRYSLGFLSEFTFRSYIVVVVFVEEKPLPWLLPGGVWEKVPEGGPEGGADDPRA